MCLRGLKRGRKSVGEGAQFGSGLVVSPIRQSGNRVWYSSILISAAESARPSAERS